MSMPSLDNSQTTTIKQLAAEKRIKEWNEKVLDERWLEPQGSSNPEAIDQKQRIVPIDVDALGINQAPGGTKKLDTPKAKMASSVDIFRPDPSIWGIENIGPQGSQASSEEQSCKE